MENWADAVLALVELLPASADSSPESYSLLGRKVLPSTVKSDVRLSMSSTALLLLHLIVYVNCSGLQRLETQQVCHLAHGEGSLVTLATDHESSFR